VVEPVIVLGSQLDMGKAATSDLRHWEREAVGRVQRVAFRIAVIETECLFVKITA
jgi:hypothetical protein